MASKLITLFEHQRLKVGEEYRVLHDVQRAARGEIRTDEIEVVKFKEEHFSALVKYNEQNESRFFTVGYNNIKFNQYVGVIAVGGITIEVLPKADGVEDEVKWQKALIQDAEGAPTGCLCTRPAMPSWPYAAPACWSTSCGSLWKRCITWYTMGW